MKNFLKLLTIFLILFLIYILYSYNNFKTNILVKQERIIEIKSGETKRDLAKKLNINYYFLRQYLKNKNFKLLAGSFKIPEKSNLENIINSLEKPLAEKQVDITILEGWNIYDIDNYLSKKGFIEKNSYISYAENPEKIKALTKFYKFLNPDFISLEGYLYPDTYKLKYPIKINELIIKQLDNFEKKVTKPLSGIISPYQEKEATNNDFYNKIILASIVEKEEKNNSEKPIVAGILQKRLENNWPIGADITVCYPHKLTSEQCKMVVSKYIREKSEYNTRTMIGLPKTPIGNPSIETILATLNSKKTKYWYYLHNVKTGKIYYAETNAKHEENKRKYMR